MVISDDLIDYGNIEEDDYQDFVNTYITPSEVVNVSYLFLKEDRFIKNHFKCKGFRNFNES